MSNHLSGIIVKDAFISYGRKESTRFATKLQKRFKSESMYAWFDATDIPAAVDWQQRIYKGIDEAHNFIFIISPYSLQSKHCFKEIKYAVKRNKRIIPLLHVKPSEADVKHTHPIISEINWIPFVEGENDFEGSFKVLLKTMQKEADYVEIHTELLLKAKHWEQEGYQNSLLLHSHEREKANEWLQRKFKPEEGVCNASDLHAEYICESKKNANNLHTDVMFFSTHGEGIRDQLRKAFHKEGITTWKFASDAVSATNREEALRQAIQRTAFILFFVSQDDLRSEMLRYELQLAHVYKKPIVPILVEHVDKQLIPAEIAHLKMFDFTNLSDNRFNFEFQKLFRLISQNEMYHRLHRNFLVQAIKWKEQGENQSTLLQGARLQEAEDWLNLAEKQSQYKATDYHREFIAASLDKGYDTNSEVFICYSRIDLDFVRKLNDELQVLGRSTWFDMESIAPGRDFETEIKNGIESSDSIIFVISPNSITSENCLMELAYAKQFNKRFINVLLCDTGDEPLPDAVSKIQWIDFTKHHKDFYKPLSGLIRSIDNQREHVREQTIWLKAAQKWDQNGRNIERLLTGADYADAESWLKETQENPNISQPTTLINEFIIESRLAIDNQKRKEQRQKRFMLTALIFVSFFLCVSIGLGVVAYRQATVLKDKARQIEQQKGKIEENANKLAEALASYQEAQRQILEVQNNMQNLIKARDSMLRNTSSTVEQKIVIMKLNEEIYKKEEIAERAQKKVSQTVQQATAKLEEIKQLEKNKIKKEEKPDAVVIKDTRKYYDGLAKDYHNGQWGYVNNKDEVVIKHQFVRAANFVNGVAQVYKNHKYGFINTRGKLISEWFDRLDAFTNGLAEVKKGKEFSYINTRGKVITEWFDDVYDFHEGLAKVKKNGKWGYIDTKGKLVITNRFDAAFRFRNGKAKVRMGERTFYINKKGYTVRNTRSW